MWQLSNINSKVVTNGDTASSLKNLSASEYSFILWHDKALVFGDLQKEDNKWNWKPALDPKKFDWSTLLEKDTLLRELRIFNTDEELYLWQNGHNLQFRYRKDDNGSEVEVDVFDTQLLLWGEAPANRFGQEIVKVEEPGRGICFMMPAAWGSGSIPTLQVRYYFSPSPITGEAVMVDMRFIKIELTDNGKAK